MPPIGSPDAVAYLQDELDAKTAAAEAARAEADAARVEAATARSNADTAAAASFSAAEEAETAKSGARASRDILVAALNGTYVAKATLLADSAIAGASVLDVQSTIDADSEEDACTAAYTAMDVSSVEGHCEASVLARRKRSRRRLSQLASYRVSVLLSSAQTNQTLIDAAVDNIGLAPGPSNVSKIDVDPVAAIMSIPGVNAGFVTTFETLAMAARTAASNALTLETEAAALDEAATASESQVTILEANAATLEQDVETTQTRLDEATTAANVPEAEGTDNTGLIAGAAVGSIAFLAIAFVGYRYRGRLFRNRNTSNNGPPRFGGSRGRGTSGFGGFSASPTARDDTAPAGAETSTPTPPAYASRYEAPSQGTPGILSPTERGWADFPPDSPEAQATAQAVTPAHVPSSSFQPRWTPAPTPPPMRTPDPFPTQTSPFPTPGQSSFPAAPPSDATPVVHEATPGGYSPSAAFAAFGEDTPAPNIPTGTPVPASAPSEVATPFTNVDLEATPASLASPSAAFAVLENQTPVTASAAAYSAAQAMNPFLAAGTAVVLSNSFKTPAPGGFVSDAESDEPFGDVESDSDADPFGEVDESSDSDEDV